MDQVAAAALVVDLPCHGSLPGAGRDLPLRPILKSYEPGSIGNGSFITRQGCTWMAKFQPIDSTVNQINPIIMNEPRRKRTGYRPLMPEALTTFFLRRKRRGIRPVKEIKRKT